MRMKYTIALACIAGVAAATISVTGQEEPLPVVKRRAGFPFGNDASGAIVLAPETLLENAPANLAEAARRNDYVSFDALYRAARDRGDSIAPFAPLYDLWTFAMTDPIGAFYGADLHGRLAGAYPAYAAFIEQHAIVDRNGNTFYPTSETRAFLLDRALAGETLAAGLFEAAEPRPTVAAKRSPQPASRPARPPASVVAAVAAPAPPVAVTPAPDAVATITTTPAEAPALVPPSITTDEVLPQSVAPVPIAPLRTPTPDESGSRGMLLVVTGLLALALLGIVLRLQRATSAW